MKFKTWILHLLTLVGLTLQANAQSPVPIYYSLNQSHSRSWAQMTSDGNVGTVTLHEGRPGQLIYQLTDINGEVFEERVAEGVHLDVAVLLYDESDQPHIFYAKPVETGQEIIHLMKTNSAWTEQTAMHFTNAGGRHIYELSAANGPNNSLHLLVLKTQWNPDSPYYYRAYQDACLYHVSNAGGSWKQAFIDQYDTNYTMDEYSKASIRQDLAIDQQGHAHVIFGMQVNGHIAFSPDKLMYATNKSGSWQFETAVLWDAQTRDSAGWYASLCLDHNDTPHISYAYISRVSSGSARNASLYFAKRNSNGAWSRKKIVSHDDGYYGRDGRDYTGGLTHLLFDKANNPHIAFTDIASSHGPRNYLNLGNIRHAVKENGQWAIKTVYRQMSPSSFTLATEITGLCMLLPVKNGQAQIIGQEMIITSKAQYQCNLIRLSLDSSTHASIQQTNDEHPNGFKLNPNYPNPFNPETIITYQLPIYATTELSIYNVNGVKVRQFIQESQSPGHYITKWNGLDHNNQPVASGTYICTLNAGSLRQSNKMLLLR